MKKPTIIIGTIIILSLLVFQTFRTHIDEVKREKIFYVHKLNFKFSTKIDSVGLLNRRNSGLIFFHDPIGTFGASEDRLQNQLKYNVDLKFILSNPKSSNVLAIITETADKYNTGDSIVVDTGNDKIIFYRKNKVISENKVTEALNGRPFKLPFE